MPNKPVTVEQIDLLRRIVLPMVQERSREPGDAWDQAAEALAALSARPAGDAGELADVLGRLHDNLSSAPPDATKCFVSLDDQRAIIAAISAMPSEREAIVRYLERMSEIEDRRLTFSDVDEAASNGVREALADAATAIGNGDHLTPDPQS